MHLRSATNADQVSIEALIFPILRSYGLEPSPGSTDADLSAIEETYFAARGFFYVLVDDMDQIFGTVAVHQTALGLCELRKMYLSDTLRGQGWGKKLLEHAISGARELGYSRMWLETANSLTESHRLYQKFGFQPFDGPHCSDRCDFAMMLQLAD